MVSIPQIAAPHTVRRVRRVQTITIAWMSVEAAVSLLAAWRARSPALLAFGADSAIELASAVVVVWRFHGNDAREHAERRAAQTAGVLLFALAACVVAASVMALLGYSEPKPTPLGIAILIAAAALMPLLAREKRRLSAVTGSAALRADAAESALWRVSFLDRLGGTDNQFRLACVVGRPGCGVSDCSVRPLGGLGSLAGAPWLFSLLILPLGIVVVGFNFTAFPLLLAQAGVPVDRIASISSIINLPGVIGFLFAPVVDIKFRRRTWLVLVELWHRPFRLPVFSANRLSHLILMTALILAGGLVTFLVGAACGGLIVKTLSESAQSKAAAWIMAGQLGGGPLGAALILWLAARVPIATVGLCTAALVALPALLAFSIPEPLPSPSPWFQGRLPQIGKELWAVVRSPSADGARCFSSHREERALPKACCQPSPRITGWALPA